MWLVDMTLAMLPCLTPMLFTQSVDQSAWITYEGRPEDGVCVTFNFTSKENPTNMIIHKGSLSPTLLPASRRNLLARRFKDDRGVETVATR